MRTSCSTENTNRKKVTTKPTNNTLYITKHWNSLWAAWSGKPPKALQKYGTKSQNEIGITVIVLLREKK